MTMVVRGPRQTPVLTEEERETLEMWAKQPLSPRALASRSRIVLLSATGVPDSQIALEERVDRGTVRKWRTQFLAKRLEGLVDGPRPRMAKSPGNLADELDGASAILNAAIDEFTEKGYANTTIRSIGTRAGMSVAAMYYYFESKHEILEKFMEVVHDRSLGTLAPAVADVPKEPVAQLTALVRARIGLVTGPRGAQYAMVNTELRNLEEPALRRIIAKRDAIQHLFDGVLALGSEQGVFRTPHPKEVARAINVMTVGVVTWYRPGGPSSAEEIADHYVRMSLAIAEYAGMDHLRSEAVTGKGRTARSD